MSALNLSAIESLKLLVDEQDPHFLINLIQIYLDGAPEKIRKLRQAIAQSDLKAAAFEAHSLKSSSANLGAMALSSIAAKIEKGAKSGDLEPTIEADFSQLELEFAQVQIELRQIIDEQS